MIPAIPNSSSSRFTASDGPRLAPGTWWRLTDPDHEIAKRDWEPGVTPPEHGIVLLLAETHVVDGEIHAVTLHGHPLLRMGRVKLLHDAFINAFAPCPEGEALRAAELAAMTPGGLAAPLARGDLAQPWRPISDAVKGGPAIWALLRDDISERKGRPDLRAWDGVQVPLRHPGTYTDEEGRVRDHGWNVAAPVGHGGFPDDWIAGWVPLRGGEAELAWVQSDRTGPCPY